MEFGLNHKFRYYIDITPTGASRTWKRIAKGISSYVEAYNDNIDQTAYIDGNGYGSSDKIGAQYIGTGTGHRVFGDSAQDYIASKKPLLGDDVKSYFKGYNQFGDSVQVGVTICNVVDSGGEAQGKTEFSFELHGNGKPDNVTGTTAPVLTAVVAPGTGAGKTKFTATPDPATDTFGYKLTSAALAPNGYSYAGLDLVAYTSGADIAASVGQYLNMYEVDADGSVIKFSSVLLDSGDFPA